MSDALRRQRQVAAKAAASRANAPKPSNYGRSPTANPALSQRKEGAAFARPQNAKVHPHAPLGRTPATTKAPAGSNAAAISKIPTNTKAPLLQKAPANRQGAMPSHAHNAANAAHAARPQTMLRPNALHPQANMPRNAGAHGSMPKASAPNAAMARGSMPNAAMQRGPVHNAAMQRGAVPNGAMQRTAMQRGAMAQSASQRPSGVGAQGNNAHPNAGAHYALNGSRGVVPVANQALSRQGMPARQGVAVPQGRAMPPQGAAAHAQVRSNGPSFSQAHDLQTTLAQKPNGQAMPVVPGRNHPSARDIRKQQFINNNNAHTARPAINQASSLQQKLQAASKAMPHSNAQRPLQQQGTNARTPMPNPAMQGRMMQAPLSHGAMGAMGAHAQRGPAAAAAQRGAMGAQVAPPVLPFTKKQFVRAQNRLKAQLRAFLASQKAHSEVELHESADVPDTYEASASPESVVNPLKIQMVEISMDFFSTNPAWELFYYYAKFNEKHHDNGSGLLFKIVEPLDNDIASESDDGNREGDGALDNGLDGSYDTAAKRRALVKSNSQAESANEYDEFSAESHDAADDAANDEYLVAMRKYQKNNILADDKYLDEDESETTALSANSDVLPISNIQKRLQQKLLLPLYQARPGTFLKLAIDVPHLPHAENERRKLHFDSLQDLKKTLAEALDPLARRRTSLSGGTIGDLYALKNSNLSLPLKSAIQGKATQANDPTSVFKEGVMAALAASGTSSTMGVNGASFKHDAATKLLLDPKGDVSTSVQIQKAKLSPFEEALSSFNVELFSDVDLEKADLSTFEKDIYNDFKAKFKNAVFMQEQKSAAATYAISVTKDIKALPAPNKNGAAHGNATHGNAGLRPQGANGTIGPHGAHGAKGPLGGAAHGAAQGAGNGASHGAGANHHAAIMQVMQSLSTEPKLPVKPNLVDPQKEAAKAHAKVMESVPSQEMIVNEQKNELLKLNAAQLFKNGLRRVKLNGAPQFAPLLVSLRARKLFEFWRPNLTIHDLVLMDVKVDKDRIPMVVINPQRGILLFELNSSPLSELTNAKLSHKNFLAFPHKLHNLRQRLARLLSDALKGGTNGMQSFLNSMFNVVCFDNCTKQSFASFINDVSIKMQRIQVPEFFRQCHYVFNNYQKDRALFCFLDQKVAHVVHSHLEEKWGMAYAEPEAAHGAASAAGTAGASAKSAAGAIGAGGAAASGAGAAGITGSKRNAVGRMIHHLTTMESNGLYEHWFLHRDLNDFIFPMGTSGHFFDLYRVNKPLHPAIANSQLFFRLCVNEVDHSFQPPVEMIKGFVNTTKVSYMPSLPSRDEMLALQVKKAQAAALKAQEFYTRKNKELSLKYEREVKEYKVKSEVFKKSQNEEKLAYEAVVTLYREKMRRDFPHSANNETSDDSNIDLLTALPENLVADDYNLSDTKHVKQYVYACERELRFARFDEYQMDVVTGKESFCVIEGIYGSGRSDVLIEKTVHAYVELKRFKEKVKVLILHYNLTLGSIILDRLQRHIANLELSDFTISTVKRFDFPQEKYDIIMIDEAQDLSSNVMSRLQATYRPRYFFMFIDMCQRIYAKAPVNENEDKGFDEDGNASFKSKLPRNYIDVNEDGTAMSSGSSMDNGAERSLERGSDLSCKGSGSAGASRKDMDDGNLSMKINLADEDEAIATESSAYGTAFSPRYVGLSDPKHFEDPDLAEYDAIGMHAKNVALGDIIAPPQELDLQDASATLQNHGGVELVSKILPFCYRSSPLIAKSVLRFQAEFFELGDMLKKMLKLNEKRQENISACLFTHKYDDLIKRQQEALAKMRAEQEQKEADKYQALKDGSLVNSFMPLNPFKGDKKTTKVSSGNDFFFSRGKKNELLVGAERSFTLGSLGSRTSNRLTAISARKIGLGNPMSLKENPIMDLFEVSFHSPDKPKDKEVSPIPGIGAITMTLPTTKTKESMAHGQVVQSRYSMLEQARGIIEIDTLPEADDHKLLRFYKLEVNRLVRQEDHPGFMELFGKRQELTIGESCAVLSNRTKNLCYIDFVMRHSRKYLKTSSMVVSLEANILGLIQRAKRQKLKLMTHVTELCELLEQKLTLEHYCHNYDLEKYLKLIFKEKVNPLYEEVHEKAEATARAAASAPKQPTDAASNGVTKGDKALSADHANNSSVSSLSDERFAAIYGASTTIDEDPELKKLINGLNLGDELKELNEKLNVCRYAELFTDMGKLSSLNMDSRRDMAMYAPLFAVLLDDGIEDVASFNVLMHSPMSMLRPNSPSFPQKTECNMRFALECLRLEAIAPTLQLRVSKLIAMAFMASLDKDFEADLSTMIEAYLGLGEFVSWNYDDMQDLKVNAQSFHQKRETKAYTKHVKDFYDRIEKQGADYVKHAAKAILSDILGFMKNDLMDKEKWPHKNNMWSKSRFVVKNDALSLSTIQSYRGAESDRVLITLPSMNNVSYELFYTGISRAKNFLRILSKDLKVTRDFNTIVEDERRQSIDKYPSRSAVSPHL